MGKVFEEFLGVVRSTAPDTPDTGFAALYPKSAGWYSKNSAGVETRVSNDIPGTNGPSFYRATFLGANGSLTSTTVSKTDFSMALNGAYVSEGVYTLTAASGTPFTVGKTIPIMGTGTATGGADIRAEVTSTSVITIRSFGADATTASDAIGTFFINLTVDV